MQKRLRFLREKNKERGFTLVELIVIIVILVVLAAALIPALLGYIDKAKREKDYLVAKECMEAVQAQLSNMYAHRSPTDGCAINGFGSYSGMYSGDVNLDDSDEAKEVFDMVGVEPYAFLVGLGKYSKYKDSDPHCAYTVQFAAFCLEKDSQPLYFDGEEWIEEYPWTKYHLGSGSNTFHGVEMQMYIYSYGGGYKKGDGVWKYLQAKH
ncbi:MAG: prepilin-type N-terminal cleavage/methylation domain-containing protein [Lachnospiraceae bacterium]|nr:prepilin-type N-terminal cleavage/methylation domain-containing protein [Lachnospiraceae bacterium]